MNDKTISKEAPENILQCWNLSGTAEQIYSTAWQVNDKYVLKRYEDLETLKKNVMKDTTCFQRSFREITRLI